MKNKAELQQERSALVAECDALRGTDGNFANDAARASFDTKMARVEAIDVEIRALDKTPTPKAGATAAEIEAARTAAITEERARTSGITALCRTHNMAPEFAADLVARGVSLDEARAQILGKLAAGDADPSNQHRQHTTIALGEDVRDKRLRGAMNWLLVRSGMAALVARHEGVSVDTIAPGEFRGLSLIDLAKDTLTRAGRQVSGMDRMRIAGEAMALRSGGSNYQTTSDFAVLLANTLHKILQASYGITPDTWSRFCAVGSVSDFRTHNVYRMGALTSLDTLNEQGEFKSKAIPDGETATYAVTTKGNIIGITREVIVNDDLQAMARLTQMMGRAAKLTIEKAVYALLAQNSGLGPTFGSAPLFDNTAHGNVSTGAALSAAAIDADRVKMALQTDPNGVDYLDLRPSILVIGSGLGGQARIINTSQYDPDTVANKSQMKPNLVVGLFSDVIDSPRVTAISSTRRYLFADPAVAPVLQVSFLEGQQEPVLDSEEGWRFNGVEMKVRLDFGVDAIDYRGAVTNAGV